MILKILLGEDDPKALLDELVFLILLDQISLFLKIPGGCGRAAICDLS